MTPFHALKSIAAAVDVHCILHIRERYVLGKRFLNDEWESRVD